MRYLITGGTGTVGSLLAHTLLNEPNTESIRVLGRSEYRTLRFKQEMPDDDRLDVVSGDVGDPRSMRLNISDVDVVYHCAAMKHVDLVEKDPYLAMHTNIEGTKNVVEAALGSDVQRVVMMSTDKVVHASSLYGATKLVAEKLLLSANRQRPIFNIVRSGNVLNSSGSVTELWLHDLRRGRPIQITDPAMTRFYIPKQDLAASLVRAVSQAPDTVLVPHSPSIRLGDLADLFLTMFDKGDATKRIIGRRPGEKLHEELVSYEELHRAEHTDEGYLVHPHGVHRGIPDVPSSGDVVVDPEAVRRVVLAELLRDGSLTEAEIARLDALTP